ncbi:hypothetical protein A6U86_12515 [Rhizobium sp. AC27/96]|nr:hypothetical protein A6U86_12515 [Rhizobium sp. AC27/96]
MGYTSSAQDQMAAQAGFAESDVGGQSENRTIIFSCHAGRPKNYDVALMLDVRGRAIFICGIENWSREGLADGTV